MTWPIESADNGEPFLTMEPLLETIRTAMEAADWQLSGMQKTTSYEYDGRWAGESTRSAYLFFHPSDDDADKGIDVFLDETSRGLRAALTLVLDGPPLGELGNAVTALDALREAASATVSDNDRPSLSIRAGLSGTGESGSQAETTLRLRLSVPGAAISAGTVAVSTVVQRTIATFTAFAAAPRVAGLSFG